MTARVLTGNPSLREALELARDLGWVVRRAGVSGEILVGPKGERWSRVNARRKDTPRKLLVALRRALAEAER